MRTQTRSLVDPQYDHLFTERERDIVHRLLASESTRTIAEKTGLTVSTVNTYVKRIRKKVGARGRVELLARVVGSENIREMVRAADLTERERDVVGSLLAGATPAQIADDCGLAVSSIQTYIKRICRKLGVRGRMELLAYFRSGAAAANGGS